MTLVSTGESHRLALSLGQVCQEPGPLGQTVHLGVFPPPQSQTRGILMEQHPSKAWSITAGLCWCWQKLGGDEVEFLKVG